MVRNPPLAASLEAALQRCRATCAEALASYGEEAGSPDAEFGATLLGVIAAIDVVLDAEPERRARTLAAAAQIGSAAARSIRRYGIDDPILRCAGACEELARRCADAAG